MEFDNLKNVTLNGKIIDLVPFDKEYFESVVELRNRDLNRYFLNQDNILTIEQQENWFNSYLQRDNDIYWCIMDKKKRFVGTIRLYDIEESICELGSLIVDDRLAKEGPYALEAQLLALNFCFEKLKVKQVINQDRIDNKVMNSLSKKLGYEYIRKVIIREIEYNYYLLLEDNFKKKKIEDIIDYWSKR